MNVGIEKGQNTKCDEFDFQKCFLFVNIVEIRNMLKVKTKAKTNSNTNTNTDNNISWPNVELLKYFDG